MESILLSLHLTLGKVEKGKTEYLLFSRPAPRVAGTAKPPAK